MAYLGVDTGGTFTDFLLLDEEGKLTLHKVLSTPAAPEHAILQGIKDLGISTQGLQIVHGSTVATNAVLEGKGVRTAYITNKGLGDVLTIGRQARKELYNLTPEKVPPLIDTAMCLEVNSRMSAQGEALAIASDEELEALRAHIKTLAPQAVAINLLFSFIDDTEEKRIEAIIPENIFISRSSDVLPEYKEYERGITTTLNAYVGPLMQGYLKQLEQSASGCNLSVMQSSGGTASVHQAGRYPVQLLLSGPAGGLKGAQFVAGKSSFERLLSFDMGGTSTDVSIIDHDIGFTTEAHIGDYPVAIPMVDMHTIGAGGGSIASVDAGGLLLVGPQSAGADPGPACYGKGGVRATVTDANVVLGRLLPEAFLGGRMALDKAASENAVAAIAASLGIDGVQAANGIIDVVNDHMVRALRVMSVNRGEDPKDYTLVSFGGAGGLHVCALAEALGMQRALVPVHAGVLSALGMLAAEATRERSRTVNTLIKDCTTETLDQAFSDLVKQAREELLESTSLDCHPDWSDSGMEGSTSVHTDLTTDTRYKGQSYTLNLPWHGLQNIEQAFHQKHKDSYGHQLDIDVELVNLRVRVSMPHYFKTVRPELVEGERGTSYSTEFQLPPWQPIEKLREEFTTMPGIDEPVTVINRAGLTVSQQIKGPALITETSATTWLAEGWSAEVDEVGNLALNKE